jgi:hypothetical protein
MCGGGGCVRLRTSPPSVADCPDNVGSLTSHIALLFTLLYLGKKALTVCGKSNLTEAEKIRQIWRAKPRTCSSLSLTSRRLFTKNSSCQAKQSIPHTTITFYGVLRENVPRLRPELRRRKNWLFHHNAPSHTYFFARKCLTKNNMTVVIPKKFDV